MRSDNAHKVSPLIEHEWIDVEQVLKKDNREQKELDLLIEIVKKSLAQNKQLMVFAESKKTVDKICEAFRLSEVKSLPYYSDLAV